MIEPRSWFYFGCLNGLGHRLVDKEGKTHYTNLLIRLDGRLCPLDTTLYKAAFHRIPQLGYSSLAWWDQTVDTRPGSNSIIFAPSDTCSIESIRSAMTQWFTWVEERLPQPLIINPKERIHILYKG